MRMTCRGRPAVAKVVASVLERMASGDGASSRNVTEACESARRAIADVLDGGRGGPAVDGDVLRVGVSADSRTGDVRIDASAVRPERPWD
jgi:hypothetical protein